MSKLVKKRKRRDLESKSLMKEKAWKEFSIFIRRRGSIDGFNVCVTCNIKKHWRELQAGHFVPGRSNRILFDERNVHPQCYACNIGKHGNILDYFDFMESKYGEKIVSEIRQNNNMEPLKMSLEDYKEIYTKYKKLNQYE